MIGSIIQHSFINITITINAIITAASSIGLHTSGKGIIKILMNKSDEIQDDIRDSIKEVLTCLTKISLILII